jgi:hypothetical protein
VAKRDTQVWWYRTATTQRIGPDPWDCVPDIFEEISHCDLTTCASRPGGPLRIIW